jgi:fluoride exporter
VRDLTLQSYVLVMIGSALGGGSRLWVSTLVGRRLGTDFPWGTLVVNVAGCLLVGVIGALLAPPGRLHDAQNLRVFLVIGVLGGYTTFSAFALETVLLAERGQLAASAGYVAASMIACILAAWGTYVAVAAALR